MPRQGWGSSGFDVASHIVFDLTLDGTGLCDCGELIEDGLKLVLQCPRRETGTGGVREGGNTLHLQVCQSVREAVVAHVHKESEVTQESLHRGWDA